MGKLSQNCLFKKKNTKRKTAVQLQAQATCSGNGHTSHWTVTGEPSRKCMILLSEIARPSFRGPTQREGTRPGDGREVGPLSGVSPASDFDFEPLREVQPSSLLQTQTARGPWHALSFTPASEALPIPEATVHSFSPGGCAGALASPALWDHWHIRDGF